MFRHWWALFILQWMHHHMIIIEASRPIRELAAEEGAELHRSELQHLKVKLDTCKLLILSEINVIISEADCVQVCVGVWGGGVVTEPEVTAAAAGEADWS